MDGENDGDDEMMVTDAWFSIVRTTLGEVCW
jgi:hypothetical protein